MTVSNNNSGDSKLNWNQKSLQQTGGVSSSGTSNKVVSGGASVFSDSQASGAAAAASSLKDTSVQNFTPWLTRDIAQKVAKKLFDLGVPIPEGTIIMIRKGGDGFFRLQLMFKDNEKAATFLEKINRESNDGENKFDKIFGNFVKFINTQRTIVQLRAQFTSEALGVSDHDVSSIYEASLAAAAEKFSKTKNVAGAVVTKKGSSASQAAAAASVPPKQTAAKEGIDLGDYLAQLFSENHVESQGKWPNPSDKNIMDFKFKYDATDMFSPKEHQLGLLAVTNSTSMARLSYFIEVHPVAAERFNKLTKSGQGSAAVINNFLSAMGKSDDSHYRVSPNDIFKWMEKQK